MYLFWFEFIFGNYFCYIHIFIYSFLLLMLINKKNDILKNHIFIKYLNCVQLICIYYFFEIILFFIWKQALNMIII